MGLYFGLVWCLFKNKHSGILITSERQSGVNPIKLFYTLTPLKREA